MRTRSWLAAVVLVGAQGEDGIATGIQGDQTSNASLRSGAVYVH